MCGSVQPCFAFRWPVLRKVKCAPTAQLMGRRLKAPPPGSLRRLPIARTTQKASTGATGPQLRIMPPTINFGNQQVNVASPAQILTLINTGDTALAFPANAIRTSQDFLVQSTTCGASLPPGTSCTANLQFKPSLVTGIAEFGTTLITDNAAGSPQPVYMQGTATVGLGLVSAVSLASSLNPSTSGQSVTFNQRRSPRFSQAFLALLLLGLGGLVRYRRAGKGWMLSIALMAVIGTIVAGCGGGGGGGSTTPKGTSTITVTATAGNLSQPATFTLTGQ